jgi:hypothetical protein
MDYLLIRHSSKTDLLRAGPNLILFLRFPTSGGKLLLLPLIPPSSLDKGTIFPCFLLTQTGLYLKTEAA